MPTDANDPFRYIPLTDRMTAVLADPGFNADALDEGIRHHVVILRCGGIDTFESCQGGVGHPCPDPLVRFHGTRSEGYRAFAWAQENNLHPTELRRVWNVDRGELSGPTWEMTFRLTDGEPDHAD